jgi:DNA-directed RNA polymerase subunit RPC12/RpoP
VETRKIDTPETRPAADAVPDRRCGRCQKPFPGDPALAFQTDWAVCPACSAVLMPRPSNPVRSS